MQGTLYYTLMYDGDFFLLIKWSYHAFYVNLFVTLRVSNFKENPIPSDGRIANEFQPGLKDPVYMLFPRLVFSVKRFCITFCYSLRYCPHTGCQLSLPLNIAIR